VEASRQAARRVAAKWEVRQATAGWVPDQANRAPDKALERAPDQALDRDPDPGPAPRTRALPDHARDQSADRALQHGPRAPDRSRPGLRRSH
jgi:hypothetical protein